MSYSININRTRYSYGSTGIGVVHFVVYSLFILFRV